MFRNIPNHYVKRAIVHPHYHFGMNGLNVNDIALLELETPIQFAYDVGPGCLDSKDRDLYAGMLTIVGYGGQQPPPYDTLSGESTPTNISRYLKENYLVDQSDKMIACDRYPTYICADNIDYLASSCFGDSGTAIHHERNGKSFVVGLTSGTDQFEMMDHYKFLCTGKLNQAN